MTIAASTTATPSTTTMPKVRHQPTDFTIALLRLAASPKPDPLVGDERQHVQPDHADPDADHKADDAADQRDDAEDAGADGDAKQHQRVQRVRAELAEAREQVAEIDAAIAAHGADDHLEHAAVEHHAENLEEEHGDDVDDDPEDEHAGADRARRPGVVVQHARRRT